MKSSPLVRILVEIVFWIALGAASVGLLLWLKNDRIAAVIATGVLTATVLYSARVLRLDFLSLPLLYVLLLGFFHLGLVFPWALGLYEGDEVWWLFRGDIIPALVLVCIACVSFQIGSALAFRMQKTASAAPAEAPPKWIEDRTLFLAGAALVLAGALLYLYGSFVVFGGGIAETTYMDRFQTLRVADTRLFTVGAVFTPIGLSIALAGASRRLTFVVLGIVGLWSVWNLWVGSRSSALLIVITAVYLVNRKGLRIPRQARLAAAVVIIFVIPMVRIIREEVPWRRLQAIDWTELTPLAAVAEMGQTIWPLAESHRLVGPNEFRGGRTYVRALQQVVPRAFQSRQAGSSLSSADLELSPADWFVWTTEPLYAKRYGGRGFSSIAEAYINFGEVGVCLVFLVLGFLLLRMEAVARRGPYILAAQAIIFPPLLWTVRNDFSVVPRHVLWGLAFLGVAKLLARAKVGAQRTVELGRRDQLPKRTPAPAVPSGTGR